jgi:nucleoside-diphosphate-sugar epimerase
MTNKYLISGASGFIGARVFNRAMRDKLNCVGIGRSEVQSKNYIQCDLFDLDGLRKALQGVTCVIHCAGYAHAFEAKEREIYKKTWLVNYQGTKNLADLAHEMGVKKFINLSSVKAMSEPGSDCVDEEGDLNPTSEYGKSKLAAEEMLFDIAKKKSVEVVNLRLSMVYGLGGKGNLERMCKLIRKHIFPPIPETNNLRSLVHVDDVVDVILHVMNDSRSHGQTFIITGPESTSGRNLYDKVRKIYGYKKISFEIPSTLMRWFAAAFQIIEDSTGVKMPFNKEILSRLMHPACYSANKIENTIGWHPNISLESGLREMLGKDA